MAETPRAAVTKAAGRKKTTAAPTRLKNADSRSPHVFATIQTCLAAHHVREIQYAFAEDGSGRCVALCFALDLAGQRRTFRLPARIEAVELVLYGKKTLTQAQRDQAYQTAWANIRDWITAQFALIDTGMAQAEEIFLPYLLVEEGHTLYEILHTRQFLLSSGEDTQTEPTTQFTISPS